MIDLTGKHIFVAGGSRGLGAASARMAAAAGAMVSVNYARNEKAAQSVVEAIRAEGGTAMAVQGDVSEHAEIDSAVRKAVAEHGPLHGLVVSAGILDGQPLEAMTTEFWDRIFAINVRGTFLAVQAAVPHIRASGSGGSIVIYTSTAGQRGSGFYSAYATTKGAQIIFMRSMAQELAPHRIRVNCIAPAWTDTDMARSRLNEQERIEAGNKVPLGRIGLPSDIAGATCFLLSDLAVYITGSTMTVDGGADMRG